MLRLIDASAVLNGLQKLSANVALPSEQRNEKERTAGNWQRNNPMIRCIRYD